MEDKSIKKTRKILLSLLAAILLLPLILYGLIHLSAVQTYILHQLTDYVSNELNVEVSAESVNFVPFRSVVLTGVAMKDRSGQDFLKVDRMAFHLDKFSWRNKLIIIREIDLHKGYFNVYKKNQEEHYNFRFLTDYFSEDDQLVNGETQWDIKCLSFRITDSEYHHKDFGRQHVANGFDFSDFSLNGLNLAVRDVFLFPNSLQFELDYFSYRGSNGFDVKHASGSFFIEEGFGDLQNFLLRTTNSEIRLNLSYNYNDSLAEGFRLDKIDLQLELMPSVVDLAEVGHFYHDVYGLSEELSVSGIFEGSGSDVKGRSVALSTGQNTRFKGDFEINSINKLMASFMNVEVQELRTSAADISNFRMPNAWHNTYLELPEYLDALGDVLFKGTLRGCVNDFSATGSLRTGIGNLHSNISLSKSRDDTIYQYSGWLKTGAFDLGKLFNSMDYLGKLDMQATINGCGFSLDDINLQLDGHISSIDILQHDYQNINLNGFFTDRKFSGLVLVDDPDIRFDFTGLVDFSEEIPFFDFRANIDDARLSKLNLFQRDPLNESVLSAELMINAHASSFDDMEGVINIKDFVYQEYALSDHYDYELVAGYTTDSIYVSNTVWSGNNQHLRIRSDFLDADFHGSLRFAHLGQSLTSFVNEFVPALHNRHTADTKHRNHSQDVDFSIRFKNSEPLSELFFPGIVISSGSWLSGMYNSAERLLEVEAHAETLEIGGRRLINWQLTGEPVDATYQFRTSSERLMLSDSLHLDHLEFFSVIGDNCLHADIHWNLGDEDLVNTGHLSASMRITGPQNFELEFLPSHAFIDGDKWQLNVDHRIMIDSARIEMHQLMAYNHQQFIMADGVLSPDPDDRMELSFANFDVSYTEFLMNTKNFEFGGIMNGYISFTGVYQQPSIGAELYVSDFAFNHEVLGDLEVNSVWNTEKKAFEVDAVITENVDGTVNRPLIVTGYINPANETQNFDLGLKLTNKKMSVWGRYMESFSSDFRGLATGNLRLDGLFSNPELSGNVHLSETGLHIPYLNTTYTFAHDVSIAADHFQFNNVLLRDSLGNTALFNGKLMHQRFKDFAVDLRLNPERLIIFNTDATQQDYYYGTAFLTGTAHIHGPVNQITMDVSARTNRGTKIALPLNYRGEIRENNFISFVSRDTLGNGVAFVPPDLRGTIAMNFDLEVTPDAELQLFFDARFGDIISGRGTGNLKLEISPEGMFNIYGDYVIEEGEYFFTLQNIINKRFRIEQGGTIRWTGDVNDADVDLNAVYLLRTQLYDLFMGEGVDPATAEVYRRRLPVETVLILEDKLFNPAISFDIRVPGGDENTRELIERVITTEQEMNRQVFSLLVLNRFLPTTTGQYNTALGYGVGSTSSELLSNQLSNWLSQISSDFDIGINYRPGDEISSQELELALSTQFFDDRVTIDGNFGVAGNETATGQRAQSASNIIGDVNVEVKIPPEGKFRVKAFNRSNTFDIINTNSPYTQGIGLFYRKEFDDFSELFRRDRPRQEAPDDEAAEPAENLATEELRSDQAEGNEEDKQ